MATERELRFRAQQKLEHMSRRDRWYQYGDAAKEAGVHFEDYALAVKMQEVGATDKQIAHAAFGIQSGQAAAISGIANQAAMEQARQTFSQSPYTTGVVNTNPLITSRASLAQQQQQAARGMLENTYLNQQGQPVSARAAFGEYQTRASEVMSYNPASGVFTPKTTQPAQPERIQTTTQQPSPYVQGLASDLAAYQGRKPIQASLGLFSGGNVFGVQSSGERSNLGFNKPNTNYNTNEHTDNLSGSPFHDTTTKLQDYKNFAKERAIETLIIPSFPLYPAYKGLKTWEEKNIFGATDSFSKATEYYKKQQEVKSAKNIFGGQDYLTPSLERLGYGLASAWYSGKELIKEEGKGWIPANPISPLRATGEKYLWGTATEKWEQGKRVQAMGLGTVGGLFSFESWIAEHPLQFLGASKALGFIGEKIYTGIGSKTGKTLVPGMAQFAESRGLSATAAKKATEGIVKTGIYGGLAGYSILKAPPEQREMAAAFSIAGMVGIEATGSLKGSLFKDMNKRLNIEAMHEGKTPQEKAFFESQKKQIQELPEKKNLKPLEFKTETTQERKTLTEKEKGLFTQLTGEFFTKQGKKQGLVIGGSASQKTWDIFKQNLPGDIDPFARSPAYSGKAFYSHLVKGGFPESKLWRWGEIGGQKAKVSGLEISGDLGTPMRSAKVFVEGGKAVEFHTREWQEDFPFAGRPVKTKAGEPVIAPKEQLMRKLTGYYEGREKDFMDLMTGKKSLKAGQKENIFDIFPESKSMKEKVKFFDTESYKPYLDFGLAKTSPYKFGKQMVKSGKAGEPQYQDFMKRFYESPQFFKAQRQHQPGYRQYKGYNLFGAGAVAGYTGYKASERYKPFQPGYKGYGSYMKPPTGLGGYGKYISLPEPGKYKGYNPFKGSYKPAGGYTGGVYGGYKGYRGYEGYSGYLGYKGGGYGNYGGYTGDPPFQNWNRPTPPPAGGLPSFGWPGGMDKKTRIGFKSKYFASIEATVFNIKGKKAKGAQLALGIRPMLSWARKKKKRR